MQPFSTKTKIIVVLFLVLFANTAASKNVYAQGIQGDLDADGDVDIFDYNILTSNFGATGSNVADIDGDGDVDIFDYNILISNFGKTSSTPTNTPAPTGATATPPTGAPYNFGPFNSNLTLIELQEWWTPLQEDGLKDTGTGFGHEHILCWWPVGRNILEVFPDGVIRTNCRLTLHDNPGKMNVLRIDLAPGDTVFKIDISNLPPGSSKSENSRCFYNDGLQPNPTGSTNCSWNVPLEVNTNSWPRGWVHIRLRFTLDTVDGKRQTTSSEIPMQLGTSTNIKDGGFADCLKDCFIAKGWYTGLDYQRVRIKNVPVDRKVKGKHTFYVQAWKGTSPRTKRMVATLDNSHFIPAVGPWPAEGPVVGPRLLDVSNPNPSTLYPVEVDTTQLKNGWHSLGARTIEEQPGISTCSYCEPVDNFQSAVGKIYFYVEN